MSTKIDLFWAYGLLNEISGMTHEFKPFLNKMKRKNRSNLLLLAKEKNN
jgi:hypothetical protein